MNEFLLVVITTIIFYFIFKKTLGTKPDTVSKKMGGNSYQKIAEELIENKKKETKNKRN